MAASVAGQVSKFFLGHDHVLGLVRLTYLNGEATIPSWYSASALLLCAGVLGLIAAVKRGRDDADATAWLGLTVLFVYLSVDEGSGIHELWGTAIKARFAPDGFFLFGWVIPGLAAVVAVGLTYWRFVWRLPAETRRLFLVSGCVFVGGGLGVEMIGAKHLSLAGARDFSYSMLVTLEETGEMVGVLIFLYALLHYMRTECGHIRLDVCLSEIEPQTSPARRQARVAQAPGVAAI